MRRILACLAAAAALGCSTTYYWTGPRGGRGEIVEQRKSCEKEIGPPPLALRVGFGSLAGEAATAWRGKMAACMFAHGYVLRGAHEIPEGQAKVATWEKN